MSAYEDGSNVYIHAATGGKTGLQNGGATCYLNAVIQVLTSISFLMQYFLCGEWMKDLQNGQADELQDMQNCKLESHWP